ncbi:uncharacterized serine-rich protein C215.13-like [Fagus crenata]
MESGHEGGTIGDHSIPGKALVHSLSSSSSASESSLEDPFNLDANAASKLLLEPDSKETLLAVEFGDGSTVDSSLRKSLSRSSSSSSSSSSSTSESSSRDSFHLGANATVESSTGTTSTPKMDEENVKGPLESSHKMLLVTEPGHGSETNGDLRAYPATTIGEADLSTPTKQLEPLLSSSSSSSESSTEDRSEMSANATSKSPAGSIGSPSLYKDTRLASDHCDEDIPVSSMPKHEQSGHGLAGLPLAPVVSGHSNELSLIDKPATQFPPVQVMERPADPASSQHRIPSSVFSRTKSTAPLEWSVTSNESLFSIHTGNTSFTKDQFYWFGKSGELGKPGDVNMSGPLIDISIHQPPTNKSTEIIQKMASSDEVSGVTEVAPSKTTREVIKEYVPPVEASHSSSISHRSDWSPKSFAFPILTGDVDKSGSPNVSPEKQKQQSEPQPQSPKETQSASQTPKAPSTVAPNRWLSCFSCCLSCS